MSKPTKEIKELQKFRAKEELIIKILTLINNYSSVEEPSIKLSNNDIINILSSIINSKTLY